MTGTESIKDLWKQRVRLYGDLTFASADKAELIADQIQAIEGRIVEGRSQDADDFFAKLCWLKQLSEDAAENGETIKTLVRSMEMDCTGFGVGFVGN